MTLTEGRIERWRAPVTAALLIALTVTAAVLAIDARATRLIGWVLSLLGLGVALPLYVSLRRLDTEHGVDGFRLRTAAVAALASAAAVLLLLHAWGLAMWLTR